MLVDRLSSAPSAAQRVLHAVLPSEIVALASRDYGALSVRMVDLRNCANRNDAFSAFSSALRFPTYFADNWDSFEECLADLDTPDRGLLLLVLWFGILFPRNEYEACTLFTIIRDVATEWDEGGQRRLSVVLVGDVPMAVEECLQRSRLSVEKV